MGKDAKAVLVTMCISNQDRTDNSKVLEKYDGYLKVQKKLIFQHATFNQEHQLSDESADQFITRLH